MGVEVLMFGLDIKAVVIVPHHYVYGKVSYILNQINSEREKLNAHLTIIIVRTYVLIYKLQVTTQVRCNGFHSTRVKSYFLSLLIK